MAEATAAKGVLIINPAAGRGDRVELIQELGRRRGLQIERTEFAGDARRLARDAVRDGATLLAVAGGDGTISEAVNGLADVDSLAAQLLVIPLGTGNDFARTLNLPRNDPAAAMMLLDEGQVRRLDLVRLKVEGEQAAAGRTALVNAATGGFSGSVHQHLDDSIKQQWGPLAYVRAALDAAADICSYRTRLVVDDEVVEVPVCAVVVANGRFAGGGVELAPEADPRDHALDVLAVTAETFLDQVRVATEFAVGTHLRDPAVMFRRARRLRVESDPPMMFSSDGELIGQTPIEFETLADALRVYGPGE